MDIIVIEMKQKIPSFIEILLLNRLIKKNNFFFLFIRNCGGFYGVIFKEIMAAEILLLFELKMVAESWFI